MGKVTSKLQVTLPKAIADQFGIRAGDEVEWVPAGEVIRVVPNRAKQAATRSPKDRVELFDKATLRQRRREAGLRKNGSTTFGARRSRGWKREDLYRRGLPR